MKKTYLVALATMGIVAVGNVGSVCAESFFVNGVTKTSGWLDVDKVLDSSRNSGFSVEDEMLCWAATSANVLAFSGWDPGVSQVSNSSSYDGRNGAMFQHYTDHFDGTKGGYMKGGYDWWFNGDEVYSQNSNDTFYGGAEIDTPGGGGFFTEANFSSYYDGGPYNHGLSNIQRALKAGLGVGIGIETNGGGHAITVWGYEFDGSVQGSTQTWDNMTGIYVTDSDDKANQLAFYAVDSSGNLSGNYQGWKIEEVQSFGANPNAVPVPGAVWLLGSGVMGLIGMRRRNNS